VWSVLVLGGVGCGGGAGGGSKELAAGGSTFIEPLMKEWAGLYDKEKGVKIDYKGGGSGKGIQQMIEGTYAFGCTDAPMNAEELKSAKEKGGDVIHIPLTIGAVVPIYNLKDVKDPIKFDGPVLAAIFLGAITKWNDPALVKLNPGVNLPDKTINVVHRADPSGTTFIWTEYLSKASEGKWPKDKVAKQIDWPAGEGAKGSDQVANQVKATEGAIGYVEVLYALNDKIPFGSVRNQAGKDILASDMNSLTAAAEGAEIKPDLTFSLTNAPGDQSYPISSAVWAVFYAKQPADKGPLLVNFLKWATHDGQKHAPNLHYAPLPDKLVKLTDKKLEEVKIGQ
jgi:phosphate transport system substrate-binding protein